VAARVVPVDGHLFVVETDDGEDVLAVLERGAEAHSDFEFVDALEHVARHHLNQRRVAHAVGLLRRNRHLKRVACGSTLECGFEPRNDLALTVNIGQRPSAFV
jgi:hypothetical protein